MESGSAGQPQSGWQAILAVLTSAAGAAVAEPAWGLSDSDLLDALAGLHAVSARLSAATLALVAEADDRGMADAAGASSAGSLLRERLRLRPSDAHADVRLSRSLARHPRVRDALAAGSISRDHAGTIVGLLRRVPSAGASPDAGADVVDEVTGRLLEEAVRFDPSDLAAIGRRILAYLDPDGPEPAERQRRNHSRREFSWNQRDDGSIRVWGQLDAEGGAALIAAVDPLAAPDPAGPDGPDPRTPGQRRADALVDLARRALDSGELPDSGGELPHITVTVGLDALRSGLGGALLDLGEVGAATARMLACDAQIIPMVLNGAGQPLDVGRATRSVPPHLRRALVARDHGCAFPGCDRPAGWTDAHHIVFWSQGGSTSLDNLVLACRHHHRRIHHDGWQVRIGHHGHPEFAPPGSTHYRRPLKRHDIALPRPRPAPTTETVAGP